MHWDTLPWGSRKLTPLFKHWENPSPKTQFCGTFPTETIAQKKKQKLFVCNWTKAKIRWIKYHQMNVIIKRITVPVWKEYQTFTSGAVLESWQNCRNTGESELEYYLPLLSNFISLQFSAIRDGCRIRFNHSCPSRATVWFSAFVQRRLETN